MKIVSGGQTGVDRAALDAAMDLGLPCGGYCPLGRKAEDGTIPEKYPLQCLASSNYRDRTLQNAKQSDVTLILFHHRLTGGTKLTDKLCRELGKPVITIDAAVLDSGNAVQQIENFILHNHPNIINVAGPRNSQWVEGYDYAYRVIHLLLTRLTSKGEDRI